MVNQINRWTAVSGSDGQVSLEELVPKLTMKAGWKTPKIQGYPTVGEAGA